MSSYPVLGDRCTVNTHWLLNWKYKTWLQLIIKIRWQLAVISSRTTSIMAAEHSRYLVYKEPGPSPMVYVCTLDSSAISMSPSYSTLGLYPQARLPLCRQPCVIVCNRWIRVTVEEWSSRLPTDGLEQTCMLVSPPHLCTRSVTIPTDHTYYSLNIPPTKYIYLKGL